MTFKSSQESDKPLGSAAEAAQMAIEAGLIYVSDTEPGIRRLRAGKGFRYVTPENRLLDGQRRPQAHRQPGDSAGVPRCVDLPCSRAAICRRPAATRAAASNIATTPSGASCATAPSSTAWSHSAKQLPKLRRKLKRDLALPGLPREKVLAVVVSLLDATRVRVGNTEYARDNKSFGLTTLRNRHVSFIRDGRAVLNFRGKGGVQHEIHIDDKRIVQIVRHCQEIPGQHLFQYINDDGQRCPIDSGQVNDYLREAMGDDFTAKDFRTWGATLHAITLLARTALPEPPSEHAFKRASPKWSSRSPRAAQHAGGLPQVLYQSRGVRQLALGTHSRKDRRQADARFREESRNPGAGIPARGGRRQARHGSRARAAIQCGSNGRHAHECLTMPGAP